MSSNSFSCQTNHVGEVWSKNGVERHKKTKSLKTEEEENDGDERVKKSQK